MRPTLDNIPRLHAPSRAVVDEHVQHGRPFILTGFLAGTMLSSFHDRDAIVALLGEGVVQFDAAGHHEGATVARYFGHGEVGGGSVNVRFPPALEARLVELGRKSVVGHERMALLVWMGKQGCLQRFHCDMDGRHNLLVQAFGDKRVCLVPPSDTQKLQPALDRALLFSELAFHRWPDADKLSFLRWANGYDCLLAPGEALYIPPLWWHFIDYLSDSLSLSWRFWELPFVDDPAEAWPLLWSREWPLWQGIVSKLASDPKLARTYAEPVRALMTLMRTPGARGVRARLRALHDELCPGRYSVEIGPADLPFFEVREERPPLRHRGAWGPDDTPRARPYLRFAAIGGTSIAVLDGARPVAEIPIDADDFARVAALVAALQRPGEPASVAALADEIGLDLEDVAALVEQLAAEGWVV
ncbi:MAG TPA: cupin-like domain-containing protein [Polyangia bacterium]